MRSTVVIVAAVGFLILIGGAMGAMASPEETNLPPALQFGDQEGCPCLSMEEVQNRIGLVTMDGQDCLDFNQNACYPPVYGAATCRAWDSEFNPRCDQKFTPKWCADSWCYVDAESCDRPMKRSGYNSASGLQYSYESCGFVDVYSPTLVDGKKKIRYTFMGEEFYRQFKEQVVLAQGKTRQAWRGAIPDFFRRIVEHMDLEAIQEVPLTQASIDYVGFKYNSTSVYTACAAMIATNVTDWCVGDAWATPIRMSMAQVTISHGIDDFLMVVRPSGEEDKESWLLLMMRPFMPFTLGAWIGYLVTVLWSLAVYAWLEVAPRLNASDFVIDDKSPEKVPAASPDNDTQEASNGADSEPEEQQQQHQQQQQPHRRSCRAATRRFAHLSVISMQLAASGLAILGDLAWKPMTYAGKLVYSVIQLFIIATVASYTANLAAVLSTRSTSGFRSLDDAVKALVPICIPDTLSDMSDLWGLGSLAMPVPSDSMLDWVASGSCAVGIMPRLYFEASRGLYGCHDESVATAGILYSKKSHMMAADDLVQPLNHAIEHLQGTRDLLRILEQQWETAWPQISGVPGCTDSSPQQEENGALTFKDMAGLYILVLVVTAIAASVECLARFWRPATCAKEYSFQVEAASDGWYAVALQDQTHIKVPSFFAHDSKSQNKPKPKPSDSFYLRPNEMLAEFASKWNLRSSNSRPATIC